MQEKNHLREELVEEIDEVYDARREKSEKITQTIQTHSRLPKEFVTYLFALAFVAFGILCIAGTEYIQMAFPYIVGSLMIAFGIYHLALALVSKDHMTNNGQKVTLAVVFALLGVMILWEDHDWDMMFISVIWGMYGLLEGARAVYHAIENIKKTKPFAFYLLKGIFELVLAFLLLHDMNIHLHIIVFGVNLIFDGITMIPFVRHIRYRF